MSHKCRFCNKPDGDLLPYRFDASGEVYKHRQRMNGRTVSYYHQDCLDAEEARLATRAAASRAEMLEAFRKELGLDV